MKLLTNKHPLLVQSQHLTEICQCLEPFGIHHFTYIKQYKNGSRISLSNKPEWIADYYNLKLYESSLFEDPFIGPKTSFNVWFGDYDLSVYLHGRDYYNTMHAISITRVSQNYCESFLFSTTPDNPEAIHYLSNNRDILYHFILYFKDKGKKILQLAEKNKILFEKMTSDTSSSKYSDKNWINEMDRQKKNFFENITLSQIKLNITSNEIKISSREIECIHHLLNHKSSRQTAEIMNISPRTVETYLENIKNKLLCESKADLIEIIKQFEYWPTHFL